MPHAVVDRDTYMLRTDDGQEFDMSAVWFTPESISFFTLVHGSEVANSEAFRRDICDQMCHNSYFIGIKPVPGSTSDDVQIHRLFHDYSVRIWGADLEFMRSYHFDFVDPLTSYPVNLPPDWKIFETEGTFSSFGFGGLATPLPPGMPPPRIGMEIKSMEAGHGLRPEQIIPGQEKYIQREGTRLLMISPSGEEASFQLPIRQSIYIEAGQALVCPGMSFPALLYAGPTHKVLHEVRSEVQ
ncbi:hypothetical protein AZE42_08131 [Rhizopogon vesiculosus]|uniref:Uncharacterized protein n=1 Tax=Rhizopogon vesiculosus TaxID=180088 RepID=A0A1J8QHA3_9AGAM|nr:hypothetical protein AZE42_08131 [Rhizopogon vesiculosus]